MKDKSRCGSSRQRLCLFVLLSFCPERTLFSRLSQTLYYRLMLQRRQRPLPGLVMQFFESCLQFGIQFYPTVQLCRGAAGCRFREVGLGEVTHVDGVFHKLKNLEMKELKN